MGKQCLWKLYDGFIYLRSGMWSKYEIKFIMGYVLNYIFLNLYLYFIEERSYKKLELLDRY